MLPLPYEGPTADPLRAVARGAAWLVVGRTAVTLGMYAWGVGCYGWHLATARPGLRYLVPGWPEVIDLPCVLVGVAEGLGGFACLRGRAAGPGRVAAAAATQVVLSPATYAVFTGYYYVTRQYGRYGDAFVAYTVGERVGAAAFAAGMSIATWLFFRYRPVRDALAAGPNGARP